MARQHIGLDELLAVALDEEALSPTTRQHFEICPRCQRQAALYRSLAAYLGPRLYRAQCPPATTLSYYCLPGALTDEEHRQITEHLAGCPRCAAELAETRQFLTAP
jgi:putative zinc finger protein